MKCEGAGKAPRSLYKAVHHYQLRNGRPWYSTGWGECSHCGGAYCVRPLKSGRATVVHHKPVNNCTEREQRLNFRRKQRWITYYNMNHFAGTGWQTSLTWAGPVTQHFNVVEQVAGQFTSQTLSRETIIAPNTFRVEVRSQTPATGGTGFLYNINDRVIVGPTDRITMAVDYATWNSWNQTITVSNYARIEGNQTWHSWTTGTSAGTLTIPSFNNVAAVQQRMQRPIYTAPVEDPAEREARRIREAEALFQRVEAQRLAKETAQRNAHETLLSLLTPQQREEYQARKQFHIRGSKGTLFRVLHGSSGNIREVLSEADEGRGLHAYCAHPQMSVDQRLAEEAGITAGHLPHEDAMIAQMLQLMVDEDAFLAVANRHW